MLGRWTVWVAKAVTVAGLLAAPVQALYIDEGQNFQLRLRTYSRFSIRTENSEEGVTFPNTKLGQMVEHRNFYNPEFEGKLTPYLPSWLGIFKPDDLSFRVAAWGFYDGIYDYGPAQFRTVARQVNAGWPQPLRRRAFILEGPEFRADVTQAIPLAEYFPGVEVQNPRDIYGTRRRINELYLNFSKGPFFLRLGRQAISWGESDTVALLDQNNPFDLTLAVPGLFQEVDEARIPLWTARASWNLFDTWGPFSSAFVEAYWVPGDLDVDTGILPMREVSPYSVPGKDPQEVLRDQLGDLFEALPVQFVLFDHIPKKRFDRSRYGARIQSVIARSVTASFWYYITYPNSPVPLGQGLKRTTEGPQIFVTETIHNKFVEVYGLGLTFFLEPIDSIIRMQANYFRKEPAFIPEINLGIRRGIDPLSILRACNNQACSVPEADFVRWELGVDRFFFLRALNPANSFTWVNAIVGSWNLDETSQKDFRFNGQQKPGTSGMSPDDFVQLKKVELFAQTHLQTDYLHGRLTPGLTLIANVRGTYAVNPTLTYRMFDWLLFDVAYFHIGGEFQQVGFFRDKDQVSVRMTYQLN